MKKIKKNIVIKAGLWGIDQEISFPLIAKSGINQNGKVIHYYFNYAMNSNSLRYPYDARVELFTGKMVVSRELIDIEPWRIKIIEDL